MGKHNLKQANSPAARFYGRSQESRKPARGTPTSDVLLVDLMPNFRDVGPAPQEFQKRWGVVGGL